MSQGQGTGTDPELPQDINTDVAHPARVGTGIPTSPNVHEVAQEAAPGTRVVYVDNDPIVLAHARALLTSQDAGEAAFIMADLREPKSITPSRWSPP